ncbi:MAG: hypothetical protein ACOYMR_07625 [Ilumatobacteraceae bacterium]
MSVRRNVRRVVNGWTLGAISIISGVSLMVGGAVAASVTPGQQGTDTSLPLTPSAVTVSGRGAFADMKFTINQTQKLTNQAISITWTGGKPTTRQNTRFGNNFVQFYQCWGDEDTSVPENPGPPPEQCQAGAYGFSANGGSAILFSDPMVYSRIISRSDWPGFDASQGVLDKAGFQLWKPFRAVDGTEIGEAVNPDYNPFVGSNFWLNPYFNSITTNEVPGAVTNANGTGAELFQVLTGDEASGLGCGKKVQSVAGGGTKVPKCWLVIVPRGDQALENAGTPFASFGNSIGVSTSPLAPNAWKNRIAIPLGFNPVDSPCNFGAVERRIAGNEMAVPAVANWQPTLCESGTLPPFSYAPVSDGTARSLVASGVSGGAGMAVVGKPLDATTLGPDNPAVYAPLTLSGLTIGFNIERQPGVTAPPEMTELEGVRLASLQLTPRLLAKLLTQSYSSQVRIFSTPTDAVHSFTKTNPDNIALDPDFLRFNPEFELLFVSQSRVMGGLQLPAGNSDAAEQLWKYVLADPEATAWLNGAADEWGMTVNPYYNAKPSLNPSKSTFYQPIPNSFPKADPYCYQAPAQGAGGNVVPPLLCGTDWMPYARGYRDTAQIGRAAADGARIAQNPLAETASAVWSRNQPQGVGQRAMLVLTDTPSAKQFGLQMASLSRAGDNGANRTFIAPTDDSLIKGLSTMKATAGTNVLESDPKAKVAGAYPLTTVTYAALTPLKLSTAERKDYAGFLEYAAGKGQVAGLSFGQLPRGYTPLPTALKNQTLAAAKQVRTLQPTPTTTTTTATTIPPTTPTFDSGGGGFGGGGGGGGGGDGFPVVTDPVVIDTTTPPVTATTAPSTTVVVDTTSAPVITDPPVTTPPVDLKPNRMLIPGLGLIALGSGLGALEITKRPRRRAGGGT